MDTIGGEGKGRGTCQTQKMRPCGHVLRVWVVENDARTLECTLVGMFWCSA